MEFTPKYTRCGIHTEKAKLNRTQQLICRLGENSELFSKISDGLSPNEVEDLKWYFSDHTPRQVAYREKRYKRENQQRRQEPKKRGRPCRPKTSGETAPGEDENK